MNIHIIARTVPAIAMVGGLVGLMAGLSFGWPMVLIGGGLFLATLFI